MLRDLSLYYPFSIKVLKFNFSARLTIVKKKPNTLFKSILLYEIGGTLPSLKTVKIQCEHNDTNLINMIHNDKRINENNKKS